MHIHRSRPPLLVSIPSSSHLKFTHMHARTPFWAASPREHPLIITPQIHTHIHTYTHMHVHQSGQPLPVSIPSSPRQTAARAVAARAQAYKTASDYQIVAHSSTNDPPVTPTDELASPQGNSSKGVPPPLQKDNILSSLLYLDGRNKHTSVGEKAGMRSSPSFDTLHPVSVAEWFAMGPPQMPANPAAGPNQGQGGGGGSNVGTPNSNSTNNNVLRKSSGKETPTVTDKGGEPVNFTTTVQKATVETSLSLSPGGTSSPPKQTLNLQSITNNNINSANGVVVYTNTAPSSAGSSVTTGSRRVLPSPRNEQVYTLCIYVFIYVCVYIYITAREEPV